jgi:hypothetical protein
MSIIDGGVTSKNQSINHQSTFEKIKASIINQRSKKSVND